MPLPSFASACLHQADLGFAVVDGGSLAKREEFFCVELDREAWRRVTQEWGLIETREAPFLFRDAGSELHHEIGP